MGLTISFSRNLKNEGEIVMPARSTCYSAIGMVATFLATLCIGGAQAAGPDGLKKIDHILLGDDDGTG